MLLSILHINHLEYGHIATYKEKNTYWMIKLVSGPHLIPSFGTP